MTPAERLPETMAEFLNHHCGEQLCASCRSIVLALKDKEWNDALEAGAVRVEERICRNIDDGFIDTGCEHLECKILRREATAIRSRKRPTEGTPHD